MRIYFESVEYHEHDPMLSPEVVVTANIDVDSSQDLLDIKRVCTFKPYMSGEEFKKSLGIVSPSEYFTKPANSPEIKDVIYNPPATIVFWTDGSKTVVKCGENDIYDPEKGLAMAIAKKAFNNQGNYYEVFKEWLPSEFDWSDLDEWNKVDSNKLHKQAIQGQDYNALKDAISDLKKKCHEFAKKYYSSASDNSVTAARTKPNRTCDTCGWQDNEGGCFIKEHYSCEDHEHWVPCKFDC